MTDRKGDDEDSVGARLPTGKLSRLSRMATLAARTAGSLAVGQAKRALGDNSYEEEKKAALKMLETLGTMKGAAMKLGQQLAMEADSLPPEARAIVARLFAQAPSMSYEDIARVVTEDFGRPPEQVWPRFDHAPLASASLGQVHRAWLEDETPLAVKVQYPGVAEALLNDLSNAGMLQSAVRGVIRSVGDVDTRPYYEELRREIGAEVDYRREARFSVEFAKILEVFPELHVPRVLPALSTGRVLTMEFVEGQRLNDFASSDADSAARYRVGRQLVQAILGPFVTAGMVHGDPHPGNFLVRPDGRMTVLDFGAMKRLPTGFVDGFWTLMRCALQGREPPFLELFSGVGFTFKGDREKARETCSRVHAIAARCVTASTYDWGMDRIVPDIRHYVRHNVRDMLEVQSPPESILFYRAVGGLVNNLRSLRAAGAFRDVVLELDALWCARNGQPPAV